MIAELIHFKPNHQQLRNPWTYNVFLRPSRRLRYPLSRIINSNSGYERARDFHSDSKYMQDTFDILRSEQAGSPSQLGSKGQPQTQFR